MFRRGVTIKFELFPFSLLFTLGLFIYYFVINIKNIDGESVGLIYAYIFYGSSTLLLLFYLLFRNLFFGYSFALMLLLWSWMAFRIVVDVADLYFLQQTMIATRGGVVFFYLFGFFLSIVFIEYIRITLINSHYRSRSFKFNQAILLLVFLLMGFSYVNIYFGFSSKLRSDIFLVIDEKGFYQRPGDFLSILFLVTSYIYFLLLNTVAFFSHKRSWCFPIILTVIYFCLTVLASLSAQMIGSNSAFVVIIGISFLSISLSRVKFQKKIALLFYNSHYFSLNKLTKIIFYLFKLGIGLSILIIITFYVLGIEVGNIRFFGFGAQSNSSIVSRINIIKDNFLDQFLLSPCFGNYNVDVETTGAGTYMHSLLLQALTHMGMVGFFCVCVFFILLFKGVISKRSMCFKNVETMFYEKPLRVYQLALLVYLFLLGSFATTINWPVLWFAIGLLGGTIVLRSKVQDC